MANAAYNAKMRKFINEFTEKKDVKGFDAIIDEFKGRVADPLNRLMDGVATPLMLAFDKGKNKLAEYILTKGPNMNRVIMENLPDYTVKVYCDKYLKEIAEMNAFLDELEALVAGMERSVTSYKSTK
jgi:hypothetical protein